MFTLTLSSASKWLALLIFASTAVYTQLRGRVRHKLRRQLFDHSTIMAPYNTLMYAFSAVKARPYVELREFPELAPIQANWEMIRDEALRLFDEGYIRTAASHNDLAFNSFFRTGWKRFYLKWYDDFLPSARSLCPKTTELLAGIPSVNAAMFALLPPGARLGLHRDPFAGSLRYHLGLATPNSPECRIVVDGHAYWWKDGEAVMFDETYIHEAENRTNEQRLILFCDIERPISNRAVRWVNRMFSRYIVKASQTENVPGEKVGVLNKIFEYVYKIRVVGKRIKDWNQPVYYALKWALILALAWWIFF